LTVFRKTVRFAHNEIRRSSAGDYT